MSKRPAQDHAQPRPPSGPLPRPLDVHKIPDGGLDWTITASSDECVDIAAEAGLEAVGALVATFHIQHRAGGRLAVDGTLAATITQTCTVSLEPFETQVERPIELTFAPAAPVVELPQAFTRARRRTSDRERETAPARPVVVPGNDDQQDPPDPIIDGRIDLGAAALEFLTLSLDLYPRKPGVHFDDVVVGDKDEAPPSPFAALARIKDPS